MVFIFHILGGCPGAPVTLNGPENRVPLNIFWGSFQKCVIYDPINIKWPLRNFYNNLQGKSTNLPDYYERFSLKFD